MSSKLRVYWGKVIINDLLIVRIGHYNKACLLFIFIKIFWRTKQLLVSVRFNLRNSHRFGTAWGWVNDDKMFIFKVNYPFKEKWTNLCFVNSADSGSVIRCSLLINQHDQNISITNICTWELEYQIFHNLVETISDTSIIQGSKFLIKQE